MSARSFLSISQRSLQSVAISVAALFLFALPTLGWTVADSSEPVSFSVGPSNTISTFDAEGNTSDFSGTRRECAANANVRWLPHSTVRISYARGEFTADERAEFRRAVGWWQRALLQLNLGIVMEEGGEVDPGMQPAQGQIIVKRDYSMGPGHYGKIVASTRPDNYVDRAFILINGSLRKRSDLRKTMLHELGHAFGLRDCPDCKSGATVMNYFAQLSVMGLNVGKAGRRISDKPTACDIAAVANGYRQSLPASATNPTAAWQSSRILIADVSGPGRAKQDENIISQYLNRKAETLSPTYFQSTFGQNGYELSPSPYSKPRRAQLLHAFAIEPFFNSAAAPKPSVFSLSSYRESAPSVADVSFTIPQRQVVAAEKTDAPPAAAVLSAVPLTATPNLNSAEPRPETKPAMAAKAVQVSPNTQRVLTDAERAEFESHIPMLLGKEAETMGELNNYTFTRDVRIQTIDSKGRVSGEYRRTSDLVFDDSGQRIERGLSLSKSTLQRLKISPEYVEDFSGVQLKGFELSKREHYRIEPFMTEMVDGIKMRVYRMTPRNLNAERAAQTRVFYGYVWVEESTGRIVKIGGCALPDGRQRFPLFETQRALVDGKHVFPLHTIADDYLVFSSHKVHVRMLITYSNYKRFESRVKITEVDD